MLPLTLSMHMHNCTCLSPLQSHHPSLLHGTRRAARSAGRPVMTVSLMLAFMRSIPCIAHGTFNAYYVRIVHYVYVHVYVRRPGVIF